MAHTPEKPATLARLKIYLPYLRPVRWYFAAAIACAILFGVASGFSAPAGIEKVFKQLFAAEGERLGIWGIVGYAALLPGVFLVRGVSGFANTYLISLCGLRVLEQLRTDYFRKLQRLPLAFFHERSSGDLVSRGIADTAQLQAALTQVANDGVKHCSVLVFAIGYLIWKSIESSDVAFMLLFIATVPVIVFPVRIFGQNLLRRARQVQSSLGSVSDRLSENLSALREVRAFNLEERETNRFRDTVRTLFSGQLKVAKYAALLSPSIEFVAAIGLSGAFVYAYHSRLPFEVFISMALALYFAYDPIKKIGHLNGELKKGFAALDRLEVILNEHESIADAPGARDPGRLSGEIEFRSVTFAYKDEPVLQNASVKIPAGTVCALVGPSGAGKTTFASLVPRFFEARKGSVEIDGNDIRQFTLHSLRRNIAIVSQDPVLFNDTIASNIRLGREDATDAEVEAAAKDAFAHDFITALPNGYQTIVGERGGLVSGGQKQRLALARAFLRNAPILILDEATSALDSQSEDAIQRALKKLMLGKTTLIIAHRFSTIRDANMILVFDRGSIVASGTHDAVLAESPLYRSLYERQQIS